jgi:type IV secretion system protein VirB8
MESDARTILESELMFGVRRRERLAWSVAIGGVLIGLGGLALAGMLLPLKETQAFLAIVDKDTGIAERAVEIQRASLDQSAAIEQSLLYSYVMNRETFDADDNEARLLRVYRQSAPQVQGQLRSIWNPENPNYPPVIYGERGEVEIDVLAINPIDDDTAQIRFTKTLRKPGELERIGKFYATVSFDFRPSREEAVELVWENPFGFTVTDYRITSETMEGKE